MHSAPSFPQPDPTGLPDLACLSDLSGDHDPLVAVLESLQGNEHDPLKWLEVALAFRAAGQPIQAIDACEACLKTDPKQVEAWFLIAELATGVGHKEMADESYDVLRQLAPNDPRIPVDVR